MSSIRSRNAAVRRLVGGSPARAARSRSIWIVVASGLRWFDHETRRAVADVRGAAVAPGTTRVA